VFSFQAFINPPGMMPLLLWRLLVIPQNLVWQSA
jgi:hypothetical protein